MSVNKGEGRRVGPRQKRKKREGPCEEDILHVDQKFVRQDVEGDKRCTFI